MLINTLHFRSKKILQTHIVHVWTHQDAVKNNWEKYRNVRKSSVFHSVEIKLCVNYANKWISLKLPFFTWKLKRFWIFHIISVNPKSTKNYETRHLSCCQLHWWRSGFEVWLAITITVVRFPDNTSIRNVEKVDGPTKKYIWSEIEWRKHKLRKIIEKHMFIYLWLIENFQVFMLSEMGCPYIKKKSVIYPDVKQLSGDTSDRAFLRMSVKKF